MTRVGPQDARRVVDAIAGLSTDGQDRPRGEAIISKVSFAPG